MRIGSPVGGDGDTMRGGAAEVIKIAAPDANRVEIAIHKRVVHKLTEDGERRVPCGFMGGTQGVADAEAHAVMMSEEDVHDVVNFVTQSDWADGTLEASLTMLQDCRAALTISPSTST